MSYESYKLKAAETLALFQFLEESLRSYLADSYELIRLSTPAIVNFSYTAEDLRNDSLVALLDKTARIYPHKDGFLQRAKLLVRKRSDCANQAFQHFQEGKHAEFSASHHLAEMESVHDEVRECLFTFLRSKHELSVMLAELKE